MTTEPETSLAQSAPTAILEVTLDRAGQTTLIQQLYIHIRELILSGRLVGGTRLPSTRQLAIDLGVSRTVTLVVYDQLAAEGFCEARRGSGQYVCVLERVAGNLIERFAEPPNTGHDTAVTTRGKPFDPTVPASTLFPLGSWTRLMARSWRREGRQAIAIDHWGGVPSLRQAVAGHLRAMQGIDCTADNVLITGGNDDALRLIVHAFQLPGSKVWVEDPGHNGARRTLAQLQLSIVPVPVDNQGIDVDAGKALGPDARLALVTSSRQFPLGMPLSLPRRLALVDWAGETGGLIVEDDYDSEIRFTGRPMASLLGLDKQGRALAIGSFSKLTFSGLRLGYIAGPAPLISRLIAARAESGIPVATSAQSALAAFIADGAFSKHLGALRRSLSHRRSMLIQAVRKHMGDQVEILPQEVGMHLTVVLRDEVTARVTDVQVAERAADQGLRLEPLSKNAIGSEGRKGFLLGFAAWEVDELEDGVRTLAKLIA